MRTKCLITKKITTIKPTNNTASGLNKRSVYIYNFAKLGLALKKNKTKQKAFATC